MGDQSLAVDAWEKLFRAQVAVLRRLGNEFPTELLSLNEYDVLFNLSRRPSHSLRIRELHRHTLLTQPSISRLIDRLVARELVSKRPDPADRRGTVVQLTGAGYELFKRVAVLHADSITACLSSALSPEELTHLGALCEKLRSDVSGTG